MQKNSPRSLVMLLSSMLIFGTIGIFRRYIPLGSAPLACFRGITGALFLILFVKLRGRSLRHGIGVKKILLLCLTGALIGFNWILLFESYNYTTVACATLCYYMQPTIVILLSPVFFRERLTPRKALCALAAVVGMVFVSGIPESGLPSAGEGRGILCGLGAAALYASVVILNKKVGGVDAYEKTVLQLGSAGLVVIPYILLTGGFSAGGLTGLQIALIVVVCLVHTGLAYALYFGALEGVSAQSAALLSYVDPVTALILSALILRESLSVFGLCGAVLIIGAAVLGERE